MTEALPHGLLVTWLGDDFTGSAAVMEALTFAGLPSVLFLETPTFDRIARFPGLRGIGIATTARSRPPDWMSAHLPEPFAFLAALGAPFLHYKVCSTLDSAPDVGSIGHATDIALRSHPSEGVPVLIAAPRMRRYQAFGHLFAGAPEGVFRLDRHPAMARHPVTPMTEADVLAHLAAQTALPSALIDLEALADPARSDLALDRALAAGARLIGIDAISADTDAAAGRLIWEHRDRLRLLVGSQGVEYALIEHWRREGMIPPAETPASAGRADRIVVVSGSVSPVTAAQIGWGAANGFALVRFDARSVCSDAASGAEADTVGRALTALARGQSPLVLSAEGPGDPAIAAFRSAVAASGLTSETANARVGESLGRVLDAVLRRSGLRRAVISGGDTSGHGAGQLGLYALTALAPTIPGAALFRGHGSGPHDGIELALKGGQMGSPDYFGWIRDGGGTRG